ncbi:MAG: hypothetical protein ACFFDI_12075 [Promethearchaeota archaeon]
MAAITTYGVVAGIFAIIYFALACRILYYGIKRNFTPSLVLGMSFYALTVVFVIDFLVSLLSEAEGALATGLMAIGTVAIVITALGFVLYSDRIVAIAITPRAIIGIFLCALTLGMVWKTQWTINYSTSGWVQVWDDDLTIMYLVLVLFAIGGLILILWSVYRETENQRQRLITLSVIVGLSIAALGAGIVALLGEVVGIEFFPRLDAYLMFLGTLFLGIAQILDPQALYFIRAKIDVCGIASDSGIPYVSYVPEGGLFDVTLGTAAIAGVQALIKEVAQAEKRVKSLDSGDKKILFEYSQSREESPMVAAFLISSVETIALRDALSHILDSFVSKYKEDLDQIVDSDRFEPFKADIKDSLSFVISKGGEPDLETDFKPPNRLSRLIQSFRKRK